MALLRPDSSQVRTLKPDGSDVRWLGAIGYVSALTYSFSCPGGPDSLSLTLAKDARYRDPAMDPGRIVQVIRGASVCWDGKLDEPQPSPEGWQLTAHGAGTFGNDFAAVYTGTWPAGQPDNAVNAAITRGLRWSNPGIGTPSGIWLSQAPDSGSETITDLLNNACTNGGLTWYVSARPVRNTLSLFPLPTTVNRLLVATTPVARTLGGDINTVWVRYQVSADTGSGKAVFALTSATDAASVAKYGPIETYTDLSNAGNLSAAAAQAVGSQVLKRYQRASYAGPFTVGPGQLLTTGGVPVDLGSEQAATVCRLMLVDFAYGGEVSPAPVQFLVGGYSYDDDAQSATITPFNYRSSSFSDLLSAAADALPQAS